MGKEPAKKARKAPAKKAPAKKTAKGPTRGEKLAAAIEARQGSAIILGKANDGDLWGRPSYYVDTRSIGLNKALGVPGWPSGRVVEVYGPESSGKSTVSDSALAETQQMGGLGVLIDTEHVRDLAYMTALGINPNDLVIEQVETVESVFDALIHWSEAGREIVGPDKPVVLVWDSVAGTPTDEEREKGLQKGLKEKTRASAAKAIKQGLRVVAQNLARTQTLLICTNQCYDSMSQFGGKKTYGGDGLPYHASIRVDLFPFLAKNYRIYHQGVSSDDAGANPAGVQVGVRIAKNKVGPPLHEARIGIIYGHGVDNGYSMFNDFLTLGGEDGPIQRAGSWYSINERLGSYPKWQGGSHWPLNRLLAGEGGDSLWNQLLEEYKALP